MNYAPVKIIAPDPRTLACVREALALNNLPAARSEFSLEDTLSPLIHGRPHRLASSLAQFFRRPFP